MLDEDADRKKLTDIPLAEWGEFANAIAGIRQKISQGKRQEPWNELLFRGISNAKHKLQTSLERIRWLPAVKFLSSTICGTSGKFNLK